MLKTNAYSTMKPVSAPHCFHNAYSQSREHYATHWSAIFWITSSGVLMYLLNWNLCKFRIALLSICMVCKPLFVHCSGLLTGLNTTVKKVIAYWGGEDIHIKNTLLTSTQTRAKQVRLSKWQILKTLQMENNRSDTLAVVQYWAVKTFNVAICGDTSWHTPSYLTHLHIALLFLFLAVKEIFKNFLKTAISLQMLKISNDFEVSSLVIKGKV